MFPRPPIARQYCRHYGYDRKGSTERPFGGPVCGVGCNLNEPGASRACYPEPDRSCDKREEWTEEERQRTIDFRNESVARMIKINAVLPPRKRNSQGSISCPACEIGTVHYSVASNGHRHAACTTPGCFAVME